MNKTILNDWETTEKGWAIGEDIEINGEKGKLVKLKGKRVSVIGRANKYDNSWYKFYLEVCASLDTGFETVIQCKATRAVFEEIQFKTFSQDVLELIGVLRVGTEGQVELVAIECNKQDKK